MLLSLYFVKFSFYNRFSFRIFKLGEDNEVLFRCKVPHYPHLRACMICIYIFFMHFPKYIDAHVA